MSGDRQGTLVYALQRYDWFVLFPVNPDTLASYRKTFCVSGAKDDPADAEAALELLLTHPEKLAILQPQSGPMRVLQQLVEQRRMLVDDVRRITNRLTDALKQYFPQVLDWFKDKDTMVFCDFLSQWPTLKQAQRARKARISAFFRGHNVRYPNVIEQRIEAIQMALPLTSDPSVIAPYRLLVEALAQQLRVLLPHVCIAAFGERRERFQSATQLQSYAGIAPVTERSGNQCWVHWRLQCPKFLRQTFVEWAALSIPHCYWAGAYYRRQRGRGSSHQAALRALAFKWTRILYRCWQQRTPYDEATYLNSLKQRGSPLMN